MARNLFEYHLTGLTRAECLWRPARAGLHIHQDAGGRWKPDWPDRKSYDLGPPSLGWLTWHAIYWTGMAVDRSFGEGRLTQEDVHWNEDPEVVCATLRKNIEDWLEALEAEPEPAWQATDRVCWPFADRTLADLAAWWNLELMKSAAEIGQLRFLYAVRS